MNAPTSMESEPASSIHAPAKTIQQKLISSSVIVLATTLLGFLGAVIFINGSLSARQRQYAITGIRNAMIAKGNILVSNNSQALVEMVADNAFLSVSGIVASTVRDDEDVVYGIYMDNKRQPWVNAVGDNPEDAVASPGLLNDSISVWAAGISGPSHRALRLHGEDVYEFAAPVRVNGQVVGVIRYGLTTAHMQASIESVSRSARQALAKTIAVLVLLGSIAVMLAFLGAQRQAARITKPIEELHVAANAIARGDYGQSITVSSDDEIGQLAVDFDTMRRTVKIYTERLEEMVAEKIQEIKDILINIEQGLFTVGLDGKVNPDYALSTNAILRVEDVAKCSLAQLFRMDQEQVDDWVDWLDVVHRRHKSMRWDKLVKLSPIQELRLPDVGAGERVILIGYQKMFDGQSNLNKVMVLVQDVTDARRIEKMIREEKERHDGEVKAILGMVEYSSYIPDFLEDADGRLESIKAALKLAPDARPPQRDVFVAELARELHTLKGTSATYGFETLSKLAREAEEILFVTKATSRSDLGWEKMHRYQEKMTAAVMEIRNLSRRLAGSDGEVTVRIPKPRILGLRAICEEVDRLVLTSQVGLQGGEQTGSTSTALALASGPVTSLLRACRSIDYVRLGKLADKYRGLLDRVGERLGKRLALRVQPEGMEISPQAFATLDEPLVHLLRNAADHGIEGEATRLLSGKPGPGLIELRMEENQGTLQVTVSDDGKGIDTERLAEKALAQGLVSEQALARMDDEEKAQLIFLSGLSTRDKSTDISGMGVGMDAVASWAKSQGGKVTIHSERSAGTRITLHLPARFGDAG